jgi:hypothetical protein
MNRFFVGINSGIELRKQFYLRNFLPTCFFMRVALQITNPAPLPIHSVLTNA